MSYHTTASGLVLPVGVSSTKKPPAADFRKLEVFARNGLICMRRPKASDNGEVDFQQCSLSEARLRLAAFIDQLRDLKRQAKHNSVVRDKIVPLEDFMRRLEKAIKQAEEQGAIEYADMRRHRVRSAPKSVAIKESIQ